MMLTPIAIFLAGPDVRPFHDARSGARDDHPAGLRHSPAELDRLAVGRLVNAGTGRSEDRHLELAAVRGENLEGVPQLPEHARRS